MNHRRGRCDDKFPARHFTLWYWKVRNPTETFAAATRSWSS